MLWEGLSGGIKLCNSDSLARFLFSKNFYSELKMSVKSSAFMPRQPGDKVSASAIRGLCARTIFRVGNRVGQRRPGRLRGFARLKVSDVARHPSLMVELDNSPWRHVNIHGWPNQKDACKMLAVELAEAATLELFSDSFGS